MRSTCFEWGGHVLAVPFQKIPHQYRSAYKICVVRASRLLKAELYHASLREPLPSITIPLRRKDSDAVLDLQSILDRAYEGGGYEITDYREDADPPLAEADVAWANQLLKAAKKR